VVLLWSEFFFYFLEVSFSSQECRFNISVLIDNIALLIAAEFPWLDNDNVIFPYPEAPPQSTGNTTDAFFVVKAEDTHP
jgi:hypothetical protein